MRRQLVAVTLATTLMVVIAFAVPLAVTISAFADNLGTQRAEDAARALARDVATTGDRAFGPAGAPAGVTLAIFHDDGRWDGAEVQVRELDAGLELAWQGQGVTLSDEATIVVLLPVFLGRDTPSAVVAASTARGRRTTSVHIAWSILGLLSLTLLGLSAMLGDRLAQRLVQPVEALADGAHRLSTGDLSARVPVGGPTEIREAATAFNSLGRRIDELLRAERESIADISHRLRTPLTALRLETEDTPIASIVDDLAAAVDEVIRDARDPRTRDASVRVDLTTVVGERLAFWAALAAEEGRDARSSIPGGPIMVEVNPSGLRAAIDALIGNVFSHTPAGTMYRVTVGLSDGVVAVTVDDAGPGLPEDLPATARGVSSAGSTGLGLDICARFADSAGGIFEIAPSSLGGAAFRLFLPVDAGASTA